VASALDAPRIADRADVGTVGVFDSVVDARTLHFAWRDDALVDAETGSRWNVLGQATVGPLAGRRLVPLLHGTHFWFAWAAFKPQTCIWAP